ncbi:hypothetical protein ACHJH3_04315 [Campylobacter sp. MOP7]|uniref:hypothetical protein n=1 Tax=Campylobacter canis TaxID=3378588 RepID=UPI00387E69D6
MKFKTFVAAFVSAIVLSGCASSLGSDSADDRAWMRYLESDESLQEISFYKRVVSALKFGEVQGNAVVKTQFGDTYSSKNLGDIYFVSDLKSVIVIDLDKGKNVNISSDNEIKSLQNSKNIKFYEFGGGMIENVIYSTNEKSVCEAFRYSLEPINTKSVTNYYTNVDKGEFFATIINAQIVGNKGFEIKNLDFKFHVNKKELTKIKEHAHSDKFKKEGIDQDMLKQGRFLLNVLCYSMFLE